MHLHTGKFAQNFVYTGKAFRPVEPNVLAGTDMRKALVIGAGDMSQIGAADGCSSYAVRNSNSAAWRMTLHIQTVCRRRAKFFVASSPARAAFDRETGQRVH